MTATYIAPFDPSSSWESRDSYEQEDVNQEEDYTPYVSKTPRECGCVLPDMNTSFGQAWFYLHMEIDNIPYEKLLDVDLSDDTYEFNTVTSVVLSRDEAGNEVDAFHVIVAAASADAFRMADGTIGYKTGMNFLNPRVPAEAPGWASPQMVWPLVSDRDGPGHALTTGFAYNPDDEAHRGALDWLLRTTGCSVREALTAMQAAQRSAQLAASLPEAHRTLLRREEADRIIPWWEQLARKADRKWKLAVWWYHDIGYRFWQKVGSWTEPA